MKDNRTTVKRSLIVSAIALVLTAALLIGTTFAWFTSTAQTKVSTIQAGTLTVGIVDESGNAFADNTIKFTNADNSDNILWEPGATFLTQKFKIQNSGTLALTYKLALNLPTGSDTTLLNNIDFSVVDNNNKEVSLDTFEATLNSKETSDVYTIKGHMKESAKDECQGLTLDGISLAVVAKQAPVEKDSYNNTYDENAEYPVYPTGVTDQSFEDASTDGKTMTAVYEGTDGSLNYVTSIDEAAKAGATTVYCKKDTKTRVIGGNDTNRTADLSHDLIVYANGSDFSNGDISINMIAANQEKNLHIEIHDAKNIEIWGNSPASGVTQTILMENCQNVGSAQTKDGRLFYVTGAASTSGTVNAEIKNCSIENADSPVYLATNGSLTVTDCTFKDCYVPINCNYKSSGNRTDKIENCVFTNCGCTLAMCGGDESRNAKNNYELISDYAAPIRYANTGAGTMDVTLTGNTITGTIGDNGDILLGVYHKIQKNQNGFTVHLTTANEVTVKKPTGAENGFTKESTGTTDPISVEGFTSTFSHKPTA